MNRLSICGVLMVLFTALGAGTASADRYGHRDGYRDQRWAQHDRCRTCGVVERIDYAGRSRRNGAGGAVAGAVIGGAVGNQIGSGDGRRAATVAGAVIGGLVGNDIARDRKRRNVYDVLVRMDNGSSRWFTQTELRGVREGARVEVRGGRVYLR